MSDERCLRYVAIPKSLNAIEEPGFRPCCLEVFFAIAHHVGTSPANDNYRRGYPGIDRIAAVCGRDRRTVIRAIAWLEERSYLYRERRGRRTTLYTIPIDRERFIKTDRRDGRAAAIEESERAIAEQQEEKRKELAAKAHQPTAPAPKLRGSHHKNVNAADDVAPMSRSVVTGETRVSGVTLNDLNGSEERSEGERDSSRAGKHADPLKADYDRFNKPSGKNATPAR